MFETYLSSYIKICFKFNGNNELDVKEVEQTYLIRICGKFSEPSTQSGFQKCWPTTMRTYRFIGDVIPSQTELFQSFECGILVTLCAHDMYRLQKLANLHVYNNIELLLLSLQHQPYVRITPMQWEQPHIWDHTFWLHKYFLDGSPFYKRAWCCLTIEFKVAWFNVQWRSGAGPTPTHFKGLRELEVSVGHRAFAYIGDIYSSSINNY